MEDKMSNIQNDIWVEQVWEILGEKGLVDEALAKGINPTDFMGEMTYPEDAVKQIEKYLDRLRDDHHPDMEAEMEKAENARDLAEGR